MYFMQVLKHINPFSTFSKQTKVISIISTISKTDKLISYNI
jgi:hypothetical protein